MLDQILPQIEVGPLWVYTGDRKLTSDEQGKVDQVLRTFLNTWTAHGRPVTSDFTVIDSQVIILAADESQGSVSGCGKDKLNQVMMQIGTALQIDFFNRMLIPVLNGQSVEIIHWNDLGDAPRTADAKEELLFIDGSIHSVREFKQKGIRPVADLIVTH